MSTADTIIELSLRIRENETQLQLLEKATAKLPGIQKRIALHERCLQKRQAEAEVLTKLADDAVKLREAILGQRALLDSLVTPVEVPPIEVPGPVRVVPGPLPQVTSSLLALRMIDYLAKSGREGSLDPQDFRGLFANFYPNGGWYDTKVYKNAKTALLRDRDPHAIMRVIVPETSKTFGTYRLIKSDIKLKVPLIERVLRNQSLDLESSANYGHRLLQQLALWDLAEVGIVIFDGHTWTLANNSQFTGSMVGALYKHKEPVTVTEFHPIVEELARTSTCDLLREYLQYRAPSLSQITELLFNYMYTFANKVSWEYTKVPLQVCCSISARTARVIRMIEKPGQAILLPEKMPEPPTGAPAMH
jgi:hypothetical protein